MHGLDDLGSENVCQGGNIVKDMARYTTLSFNITHLPTALIQGVCLPKECTPEKLASFSTHVTAKLNTVLAEVQKKWGIFDLSTESGFVRDFTEL